ncbi:MAG: pyruvate dehydrogenase (acetyl-transferring) E1 component subunit alpha [Chloroflexi bacterium]|nr:pyruvate dehydrogenase (acetyl-transferring) E1 component subunit alpha [Chloroflexota bacterium]
MGEERLLEFLRRMLLIRRFEEKAAEMYALGKIGGFLHLYIGEEAVAVGAMAALEPRDYVITHYREHGHALARGLEPGKIMAELFGKATGVSRGKGGSMHLFDARRNFMGGYAIVGGSLPLSVGLALASDYLGEGRVVLSVFGDGAVNQGEFHESLNLAALWHLPVVFLCENNLYALSTPIERASAVTEVFRRGECYGIRGRQVDGMDVQAVYEAVEEAVARVRGGSKPVLVEALTYRYRGHSMADPVQFYRKRQEEEKWKQWDPLLRLRQRLESQGRLPPELRSQMEREVEAEVEAAVAFAEESPPLPAEELCHDVYSDKT